MTETEKMLRREIVRLETEKEDLLRRLQYAENLNYKAFRTNQELSYYIKAMEGGRSS